MEILLRIILVTVKLVSLIVYPFCYVIELIRPRISNLPAIRNRLITLSAQELRRRLRTRQLTSVELVTAYIERIKAVNPELNALVESRFTDALAEASKVDGIIADSGDVEKLFRDRPLLGLPMTVKESCSLGGMSFAVGSKARSKMKAKQDGVVVKRIRSAGAIPLLVSATPEYCYSIATDTLQNGRCCNPYDYERTSGGSSGGECIFYKLCVLYGSLNGAGASLFGLGSDIGGSIRIPSLFCGVFGHKPSGNIVTVDGHFPNSTDKDFEHYLVLGPITRFAVDLPELLEVMAGDKAAKLRLREPVHLSQLKVHYALGFDGLNGWMHQPVDKEIKVSIHKAIDHLKTLGLTVELVKLPGFRNSIEIALSGVTSLTKMDYLLDAEPTEGTSKVGETLGELVRSFRGQSNYTTNALIFDLMRRTNAFMPALQMECYLREAKQLIGEFTQMLGENGVLFFPTMHAPAARHKWTLLPLWGIDYTLMFNVLGLPVTHVPMGLSAHTGLPIGFSVIAGPNQDRICLAMAAELERAFGGWCPPTPHKFDN